MKIQKKRGKCLLVLSALAAAFFLCACGGSADSGIVQRRRGSAAVKEREEAVSTEIQEAVEKELALYILVKIDTEQKTVAFQNTNNGRESQYDYDTGTQFLNKYGDTRSTASFLPGDAVEAEVDLRTQKLSKLQLSGSVWIQEDLSNYSIDPDIRAFTIGQTRYAYDEDLEIFSGETKVSFDNLRSSDVLRAVGIDKKILSLSVTKGHGYLALANTKLFEGSFICVGEKIFQEVTKDMRIEVPEGTHLVTVANEGYGGSREVLIERDRTTSLNLDEMKGEGPKICKVTFDVGVDGAVLWIDGKKADYSKPVEMRYGVHTIVVEAEGYDAITKKLVVNSEEAEIEIALTSSAGQAADAGDNGGADGANNGDNNNNNGGNNSNNSNGNGNNNNNNNGNNNNNSNTYNNNNNNGSGNNNSDQTDYLTTLYNLLTSINKKNSNKDNDSDSGSNSGSSSNSSSSYDDLSDG